MTKENSGPFAVNRRHLLGLAAATLVAPALAAAGSGVARGETKAGTGLAEASKNAFIYGLPLIESARARARALSQSPVNTLTHKRVLSDYNDRFITTPNNDTLYSVAWLDLKNGPAKLTIPQTGSRYVSVALLDFYTNNFAILGTQSTGRDGGTFTIVGPEAATDDPRAIRAPTRWVWLLVRLLVDGPDDLAAAHAVQDGFSLEAPAAPGSTAPAVTRNAEWNEYFSAVQALLSDNAPPATDDAILRTIAPLGLSPKGGFDPGRFSQAQVDEIKSGIFAASVELTNTRDIGRIAQGWRYPRYDLGDYHQAYLYRAQVAVAGLAALPPREAIYLQPRLTPEQAELASGKSLLLRFPAGQLPPVAAFWSLSIYEATPDNQFFFFKNPIDRYSIGDRTKGLVKGADGSLDIWISRDKPSDPAKLANWLPAPETGPFSLFLRGYLPAPALLSGAYLVPALQLV